MAMAMAKMLCAALLMTVLGCGLSSRGAPEGEEGLDGSAEASRPCHEEESAESCTAIEGCRAIVATDASRLSEVDGSACYPADPDTGVPAQGHGDLVFIACVGPPHGGSGAIGYAVDPQGRCLAFSSHTDAPQGWEDCVDVLPACE
jgi:hypothetical protein